MKVRQDIRYAINAEGWTAVEVKHDGEKVLAVTPLHAQPVDLVLVDVMRGVAESVTSAARCLTRQKRAAGGSCHPPGGGSRHQAGNLMSTYISLHGAEADSLLLLDADRLKAKLPSIYEQAVAYLPKGDKRITAVTNLMSPSTKLDPEVSTAAPRGRR